MARAHVQLGQVLRGLLPVGRWGGRGGGADDHDLHFDAGSTAGHRPSCARPRALRDAELRRVSRVAAHAIMQPRPGAIPSLDVLGLKPPDEVGGGPGHGRPGRCPTATGSCRARAFGVDAIIARPRYARESSPTMGGVASVAGRRGELTRRSRCRCCAPGGSASARSTPRAASRCTVRRWRRRSTSSANGR
jgi:hypothetical protein